jgi:hypothetical protein
MALKAQQSYIEVMGADNQLHEIEEVNNITGPDGKAKLIDTTHLRSTGKEYLQGIADFGQVSLDMNFTGDTYQMYLRSLYANQSAKKMFRLRIPDDAGGYHVFTFDAVVTSWNLDLKTDDKAGLKATIQVTGGVDYSAPLASPNLN